MRFVARSSKYWPWVGLLFLNSAQVIADPGRLFSTRSNSPVTQIFGLPSQPSAQLSGVGKWESELVYRIVNHADMVTEGDEAVVLDGETRVTNLALSYGLNEKWQLGADIAYLSHQSGKLDGFIEDWHDLWGISNDNRSGPQNVLDINYAVNGLDRVAITRDKSGIGDVRLWANYELGDGSESGTRYFSRLTIKLPTGDEDDLLGSGAMDVAADVAAQRRLFESRTYLDLIGHLGVLVLGDGDVLASQQESVVPYGGAGLVWGWSDRFELVIQASIEGSYFESDLDEIGGTSIQLTAGGRYRWVDSNFELAIAIVEDLVSDATPDVAFHFELRKGF